LRTIQNSWPSGMPFTVSLHAKLRGRGSNCTGLLRLTLVKLKPIVSAVNPA
jgi:hypothetical protein